MDLSREKAEGKKSENTHAKTRRSLRDREKIFKLSASPTEVIRVFPAQKKKNIWAFSRDRCHLDYFGGDTVVLEHCRRQQSKRGDILKLGCKCSSSIIEHIYKMSRENKKKMCIRKKVRRKAGKALFDLFHSWKAARSTCNLQSLRVCVCQRRYALGLDLLYPFFQDPFWMAALLYFPISKPPSFV